MLERRLTTEDKAQLEGYNAKCEQLRQYTLACIKGTHTGLMLFGSGGNGKSFSIRQTLDARKINEVQPKQEKDDEDEEDTDEGDEQVEGFDTYVVHLGRITPKGLVKEMAAYPLSIHLIEDAETMFDDKNCWGVLRQALHSQDHSLHPSRRITWKTSVDGYDFIFQGSLIVVGNRLMDTKREEVQAVETRCPCVTFDVTNPEMIAKMKELCEKGYATIPNAHLSREECYDVLDFILTARSGDPALQRDKQGNEIKLNFRILISGFRFLALSKLERCIDWKRMLLGQMEKQIGGKRKRAERVHDERKIAQELAARSWRNQHDKLVEYCRRTGRSLDWSNQLRTSEEYRKGFFAAKRDFDRKNK